LYRKNPGLGALDTTLPCFDNAYLLPEFLRHRPLFTTKTEDFAGWIDHVFVGPGVSVRMVLSTPVAAGSLTANTEMRTFDPIPNRHFPSDHLPVGIVAEF